MNAVLNDNRLKAQEPEYDFALNENRYSGPRRHDFDRNILQWDWMSSSEGNDNNLQHSI